EAYERWKRGVRDVVFPAGSYAMRVYQGVAVADTA
ncbi:MAG: transposase, partial [Deltaproteobacteria bacterium]